MTMRVVHCCRSNAMVEWADKLGLEQFALVGHSLGGYLSATFALRHPHRVSNLVLVSPVGIPEPHGASTSVPLPSSEPSDDQPLADAAEAGIAGIEPEVWRQLPWQMRMIVRAWGFNVTPQSIVRFLGSYGPKVMTRAVMRRFSGSVGSDEVLGQLVADYLYHVTASEGSGEFAMNALMAPRVVNGRPGVCVCCVAKLMLCRANPDHPAQVRSPAVWIQDCFSSDASDRVIR